MEKPPEPPEGSVYPNKPAGLKCDAVPPSGRINAAWLPTLKGNVAVFPTRWRAVGVVIATSMTWEGDAKPSQRPGEIPWHVTTLVPEVGVNFVPKSKLAPVTKEIGDRTRIEAVILADCVVWAARGAAHRVRIARSRFIP